MSDFGYYPVNDFDGAALPKIDDLDECFVCRSYGDNYDGDICLCSYCDVFQQPTLDSIFNIERKVAKLEDQLLCDRYNNAVDQLIDDLPF